MLVAIASAEVLDTYNGRATLLIADGSLHWMILGQVEPFDLWLEVPLTYDEQEQLSLQVPADLDTFVTSLSGRGARFTFSLDGERLAKRTISIDPSTRSIVAEGVLSLVAFLEAAAQEAGAGSKRELLTEARHEMSELIGYGYGPVT
ncbi:hypothetical protein [Agromyces ramosus]|uniref:Uncharacterized protein n=1 Tax=Agromyces ramosus TaxID=33879 RepID=A0ABU0RAA2_9MICO|nr:hypothetical protein [Agromyces ramosus]MDQ0895005.1 hypothetical protein [Agromyces ramosus]